MIVHTINQHTGTPEAHVLTDRAALDDDMTAVARRNATTVVVRPTLVGVDAATAQGERGTVVDQHTACPVLRIGVADVVMDLSAVHGERRRRTTHRHGTVVAPDVARPRDLAGIEGERAGHRHQYASAPHARRWRRCLRRSD